MIETKLNQSNAVLEARQVSKTVSYAGARIDILQGVDLQVNTGETVAICGSSGSGKTTLLGILAGMDVPTSGSVLLGGNNLTEMDEEQRTKVRSDLVGFVFQSFQLIPSLSALENVMLPLELKRHKDADSAAHQFLNRVGLSHRLHHMPRQLSGGEQQRVAIARAFACEPRVLFADEPTGNLDNKTGHAIIELLFNLNEEQGVTLVMVTHDPNLADRCQKTVNLVAGRLEMAESALDD